MHGTPVFFGTRVPVQSLWDYFEAADSLEEFLRDFPSVKREQAVWLIRKARMLLSGRTIEPDPSDEAAEIEDSAAVS